MRAVKGRSHFLLLPPRVLKRCSFQGRCTQMRCVLTAGVLVCTQMRCVLTAGVLVCTDCWCVGVYNTCNTFFHTSFSTLMLLSVK